MNSAILPEVRVTGYVRLFLMLRKWWRSAERQYVVVGAAYFIDVGGLTQFKPYVV